MIKTDELHGFWRCEWFWFIAPLIVAINVLFLHGEWLLRIVAAAGWVMTAMTWFCYRSAVYISLLKEELRRLDDEKKGAE